MLINIFVELLLNDLSGTFFKHEDETWLSNYRCLVDFEIFHSYNFVHVFCDGIQMCVTVYLKVRLGNQKSAA